MPDMEWDGYPRQEAGAWSARGRHGNPATRELHLMIRETLRSRQYEVIVVTAMQLYDRAAMVGHLQRIAQILIGRERRRAVKEDPSWYVEPDAAGV